MNRITNLAGIAALAFLWILALASCQKDFEWDVPLAVTQKRLNLTSATGSTHIQVYATDNWTVRFAEAVEWASLSKLSGKKTGDFVFAYSGNYGVARDVQVVIDTEAGMTDTITIVQAGDITDPMLLIPSETLAVEAGQTEASTPLETNLKYDLGRIRTSVDYVGEGQQDWVRSVTFDEQTLKVELLPNTQPEARSAEVALKLRIPATSIDGEDRTLTAATVITQRGTNQK